MEKSRRPNTLMVDVIGSHVGLNGSAETVCSLYGHNNKHRGSGCIKTQNDLSNTWSNLKFLSFRDLPQEMTFNRYNNCGSSNNNTARGRQSHSGEQQQVVGVHKPLASKLKRGQVISLILWFDLVLWFFKYILSFFNCPFLFFCFMIKNTLSIFSFFWNHL